MRGPRPNGGFGALAQAPFRIWLVGTFFSRTGEWSARTAQDWLVLAVLTDGSGAATGAAVSLQYLPVLLFGPYAGVLADRLPRRRLLMVAQVLIGVNTLTMSVLVAAGIVTLPMVLISAFVLGCASALDLPARQAAVTDLVPRTHMMSAIGLNGAMTNLGRMSGPVLAGVVIAVWGTAGAFLVTTVCATIGMLVLAGLRRRPGLRVRDCSQRRATLRDGLRYVGGRADLAVLLVGVGLVSMFASHSALMTALMSTTVFHRGADLYVVVGTTMALGSLLGSLASAYRPQPRLGSVVAGGLGLSASMLISSVVGDFRWYALMLFPIGVFMMTYFISVTSAMQIATAPHLRGRILALFSAVQMGSMAVGASIVGTTADVLGARWAVRIGGCAALVAAVVVAIGAVRRPEVAATFRAAVTRHGGPGPEPARG
ncbi:MFS transporter [Gordonia sp. ABSL1-1]|uniref:MFS transporter n=1 Tax=Gordonia sp. ABSL1-1 TaxID=3053923 RepID=UPI002572778A|nr:MFS transporter [Gordonia sp. ABSL1-1]MDL9937803.1 MFS transporter [Gordonia sp. ABSL1-1]